MTTFKKLVIAGLLIVLLLSLTSCKTYQWSGSYSVNCNGHFSWEPMQCTITFTSPTAFDWTASSTVDGVTIQPSSGEEVAGKRSEDIHVTVPAGACPGSSGSNATYTGSLNFTDDARDEQLSLNLVSAGGGTCAFQS